MLIMKWGFFMKNLFVNAIGISKTLAKEKIKNGDIVVDATMGNGNDTAYLSELVGKDGKVYAFDIQEQAIENTKSRLSDGKLEDRVKLIHDGHENINMYVKEKVKLIIYNLGYLPSGDHDITTESETTIQSIGKGLGVLEDGGLIIIVVYPGHENGRREKESVLGYTKTLNQKEFSVLSMEFENQVNYPPGIICIEKLLTG